MQTVMNFKNTVSEIKRLIGHKFDEPYVQAEIPKLLYKVIKLENGDIGVEVKYLQKFYQMIVMIISCLYFKTCWQ